VAETRQTILERVALYIMELRGAEEVEEKIEATDQAFLAFAKDIQATKKEMVALSHSFKILGTSISASMLQQLPQTTEFLKQYGVAMKPLQGTTEELSAAQWVLTDAGREAAISTGLMAESMEDGTDKADGLKDKFWQLNTAARALLRVFVGFKVLVGMLGFLKEMAEASFNLQAELARLRVVISGVSDQIEGDAGSWEEWLDRIERLRDILPLISTTELVKGLRTLTGILGPLGLTADEIERVAGLVGQMSTLMGRDYPSYISLFIGALSGAQRNVAAMGIDLRDGNRALQDYAESLGFVWDELNAGQKQWIRLGFFVEQAAERTVELTEVMDEEWAQLEELRKKREDILAQAPELISAQIKWAEVLLTISQYLEMVIGLIPRYTEEIRKLVETLGWMIPPIKTLIGAWDEWQEHLAEERALEWVSGVKDPWMETGELIEDFNETVRENAEALEDAADSAEEFADRMERALQQAGDALRSYQRAVESAGIRLGRRLTDIVRNLEEKLADLESRFELRRAQLLARFEERRADLREEGAEREEELRADLNKRLQRMEEDHLLDMQELREDYLIDLQEAARKRDAVSMRRIQQRYILEKKQRVREYGVRRRRAIEDYKEQIDELKKAREEQERELEKSLERQLRELQENYERQQEEARLNAERQREDALRNYQEQLDDLWRNFQARLETIAINLIEEEREFEDTYEDLRDFFDQWYTDDLTALGEWLAKRAFMIQMAQLRESLPPWMQPFVPPVDFGMAQGGMGVARQPTRIMVGEAGPEMFAAWPLGQRMPRAGVDVRLTIDGTQAGAWSGDFENQTLRILREVLEEAL